MVAVRSTATTQIQQLIKTTYVTTVAVQFLKYVLIQKQIKTMLVMFAARQILHLTYGQMQLAQLPRHVKFAVLQVAQQLTITIQRLSQEQTEHVQQQVQLFMNVQLVLKALKLRLRQLQPYSTRLTTQVQQAK